MTKKCFILFVAMLWNVTLMAQQIAVVSDGNTSVHSTLQAAIEAAPAGSVIYLPGGGFPIDDSVKINKPLNIIGIGYWVKGDNVDGYTSILGNLHFNEGSDGSSVMGVYMTGRIRIGNNGKKVDNVLVRYNWIDGVYVQNSACMGTVVNQNYIRSSSSFSGATCEFNNNVACHVSDLDNGSIEYNIFYGSGCISSCHNTSINCNVLYYISGYSINKDGGECQAFNNMYRTSWGVDCVEINSNSYFDLFVNWAGITPKSDFHFKGDWAQYNGHIGVYGGSGFSSSTLPPVPYIVAKQIPEQTDANGKLNIKIRVRAGE
jgi:hypothetical protein